MCINFFVVSTKCKQKITSERQLIVVHSWTGHSLSSGRREAWGTRHIVSSQEEEK